MAGPSSKPGNDAEVGEMPRACRWRCHTLRVTRGLDPRVHSLQQRSQTKSGWPGQAWVKPGHDAELGETPCH